MKFAISGLAALMLCASPLAAQQPAPAPEATEEEESFDEEVGLVPFLGGGIGGLAAAGAAVAVVTVVAIALSNNDSSDSTTSTPSTR